MDNATTSEGARQRQWVARHLEGGGAFFFFSLDGTPSDQFLLNWDFAATAADLGRHRHQHRLTWTDATTGLEVRCQAIEYGDFPTVEWTLHLRNTGASHSPLVRDLQPLDVNLRRQSGGEFVLHHWSGDACTPDSYQPHHLELPPGAERTFAPVGGRPCNQAFPYFNLEWNHRGLIAAIDWPGQWALHLNRDGGEGLRLCAGQELTCFRLEPGEEVRTPLVVLQFWEGEQIRSHNLWRRWMLAHNLPRDAAQALPLLRSDYQSFQGDPAYAPGNQCHTYGLSSWLPYYGQGVYYRDEHLEYNVRSHFCPAFGLGVDVRQPGIDWPRFTKLLAQWRAISGSLLGDYYPLTPYSLEEEVWMAWQFHQPSTNAGAVQAFRRTKSKGKSMRFKLQGLEPGAVYVVEDLGTHKTQGARGEVLMAQGLEVRISTKPGAAVFSYRPAQPR